jgi:hypothetical protein
MLARSVGSRLEGRGNYRAVLLQGLVGARREPAAMNCLRRVLAKASSVLSVSVNVVTIATFALLVFLSPTVVRLHPEAIPQLSGFGAFEDVSDLGIDEPEALDRLRGPVIWLEGFVANAGTALASGLALEVVLQEDTEVKYGKEVRPTTRMLMGVVGDTNAYQPDVDSALEWNEWDKLSERNLADIDSWSRLYLPPIPPGAYVQVFIGLPGAYCKELTIAAVQKAIAGGVAVRLVQLTQATKASSFHGEEIPGHPRVIDGLRLQFRNRYLDWSGVEG